MHYPSIELVAVAWAKAVGGDVDPTKVATTLPADASAWASTGFVVVTAFPGSVNSHVPLSAPVVTFDCWAAAPGSNKAPWGMATALANELVFATYRSGVPDLAMPDGFHPARLLSVWPVGGPTRIPSDEAGFARVSVDLQLAWTTTAEVA